MNTATFHRNLLGQDQEQTPERYRLTDRHQELYDGFESTGVRGFANEGEDEELFLGTLVLALHQTDGGTSQVTLIIPPDKEGWADAQILDTARYVFRSRKGNVGAVRVLRNAFHRLQTACQETFHNVPEPRMWVAYGYGHRSAGARPLPDWMKGRLIDANTVYLSDFT